MTLSGGQKARMNLARAIYRSDADIFLLDDPLSAVDTPVARHIFDKLAHHAAGNAMYVPFKLRCICGLLKDRLVILITHQVQFALQASKILALKEVSLLAPSHYSNAIKYYNTCRVILKCMAAFQSWRQWELILTSCWGSSPTRMRRRRRKVKNSFTSKTIQSQKMKVCIH